MKITITRKEEIELDYYEQRDITVNFLKNIIKLYDGRYIKNDELWEWFDTGHGSGLDRKVRNLSPTEIQIYNILILLGE